MRTNPIAQTVDAEITAMMPSQRACVAEKQVRNTLSNGPRRAQSNGIFPEYSATCGHTSVAGDMMVSRKGTGQTVKQGGTADHCTASVLVSSLAEEKSFCRGRFCF